MWGWQMFFEVFSVIRDKNRHVTSIGSCRFIQNSFQFIIHQSFFPPALYRLNADGAVKQITETELRDRGQTCSFPLSLLTEKTSRFPSQRVAVFDKMLWRRLMFWHRAYDTGISIIKERYSSAPCAGLCTGFMSVYTRIFRARNNAQTVWREAKCFSLWQTEKAISLQAPGADLLP
jgi:hypothetical protein